MESDDDRIIAERTRQRKIKRNMLSRMFREVRREVWELLTTTTTLEDKTQEDAPKYFSYLNVDLIGLFKRALFSGLFLYFFATVYIQTTTQQEFIGADLDSGICKPIPITWNEEVVPNII